MREITLHSRKYTVSEREGSTWLNVHKDKVGNIAIVPEFAEARQCIYDDLIMNGFSCEYLTADDFSEG